MARQSSIEQDGIIEALSNAMFRVELKWTCNYCSYFWKRRMHYIRLLPGDKVKLEISMICQKEE